MENIQISHTYILVPYSAHTDTVSNVCTYFALWFLSENWWAGGGAASHLYINQEVGGGGGWVVGDLSHSVAVGLSSR